MVVLVVVDFAEQNDRRLRKARQHFCTADLARGADIPDAADQRVIALQRRAPIPVGCVRAMGEQPQGHTERPIHPLHEIISHRFRCKNNNHDRRRSPTLTTSHHTACVGRADPGAGSAAARCGIRSRTSCRPVEFHDRLCRARRRRPWRSCGTGCQRDCGDTNAASSAPPAAACRGIRWRSRCDYGGPAGQPVAPGHDPAAHSRHQHRYRQSAAVRCHRATTRRRTESCRLWGRIGCTPAACQLSAGRAAFLQGQSPRRVQRGAGNRSRA